jgi:apolipoprotein N-acyltransferase-like protein
MPTDARGAGSVAPDRIAGSEPHATPAVIATIDRLLARRPWGVLLFAGGLSALGFAPLNLWPLTFLSLALLIHYVRQAKRLAEAAQRGWIFGVGHFIVGLNWIATAFTYQDNMPAWLGWAAVVLLSLYLALFPALASALAWRASRQQGLAFVFVFAAAWMLSEWLRASLLTGFAWNPLAVVCLELPWVAQGARWIPSSRGHCCPRPSQTRTGAIRACGSSLHSFAHAKMYRWTIRGRGRGKR